jgi:hypothetical protein
LRVLLVDVDSVWANLALMKIGAWHKKRGDNVHLLRLPKLWRPKLGKPVQLQIKCGGYNFDKAYISCIFTKNREKAESIASMMKALGATVEVGGSGVSLEKQLPEDVEHQMPLYELYGLQYSMGFTTRGCVRRCPWCLVWRKEGDIKPWSPLKEFLHPRHDKVMLLDNNLLAYNGHMEILEEIVRRRLQVCFTQGLDIRLIDDRNAKWLRLTHYRDTEFKQPRLYFSWDTLEIEDEVARGIATLKRHGIPPGHLLFYMLCAYNIKAEDYTWEYFMENDWYRYKRLAEMGVKPFIMKWNGRTDIKLLNAFAKWVNYKHRAKRRDLGLLNSFKSYLKYEYDVEV